MASLMLMCTQEVEQGTQLFHVINDIKIEEDLFEMAS